MSPTANGLSPSGSPRLRWRVPRSPSPTGKVGLTVAIQGRGGVSENDSAHLDSECQIQVTVRCRPLLPGEHGATSPGDTLQFGYGHQNSDHWVQMGDERHEFDSCLGPEAAQDDLATLSESLACTVAGGHNACLLACGAAGTGKSHTVFGRSGNNRGALPRAVERLFDHLGRLQANTILSDAVVTVSYLALHGEKIRDVLAASMNDARDQVAQLQIREHPDFGVFVPGVVEESIEDVDGFMRCLHSGHRVRATSAGAWSDRSHAIVTLRVSQRRRCEQSPRSPLGNSPAKAISNAGWGKLQRMVRARKAARGEEETLEAWLQVADLAGTDYMSIPRAGLGEAPVGNRGLVSLSQTIARLAEGIQGPRVVYPLQTSKLTHLLSDALMGNCRTHLVTTVSPASAEAASTLSSLRIAAVVRGIRTAARRNIVSEERVGILDAEVARLREQLRRASEKQNAEVTVRLIATEWLLEREGLSNEQRRAQSTALQAAREARDVRRGLRSSANEGSSPAPTLANLSPDALLSGTLVYAVPVGRPVSIGGDAACSIRLEGGSVRPRMCCVVNEDGKRLSLSLETNASSATPSGTIRRQRARKCPRVRINGHAMTESDVVELHDADVLSVGHAHAFMVSVPEGVPRTSGATASRLSHDRLQWHRLEFHHHGLAEDDIMHDLYLGVAAEEVSKAQAFVDALKRRFGDADVARWLEEWHSLSLAAEEAQDRLDELDVVVESTETIHGPLELAIGAIVSPAGGMHSIPELVVRLGQQQDTCSAVVALWSPDQFRRRLIKLRELHHEVVIEGEPWDLHRQELAPWREFGPAERAQVYEALRDFGATHCSLSPTRVGGDSDAHFAGVGRAELVERIEEQDRAIRSLREQVEATRRQSVVKQVQQMQAMLDELRQEKERAEEDRNEARQILELERSQVSTLRARAERAGEEHELMRRITEPLDEENQSLRAEHAELRQKISELEVSLASLTTNAEHRQKELQELLSAETKARTAAESRARECEEELAATGRWVEERLNTVEEEHKQMDEHMRQVLHKLRGENDGLREETRVLAEKLKAEEVEKLSLLEKIALLEEAQGIATEELNQLRPTLEHERTRTKELKHALEQQEIAFLELQTLKEGQTAQAKLSENKVMELEAKQVEAQMALQVAQDKLLVEKEELVAEIEDRKRKEAQLERLLEEAGSKQRIVQSALEDAQGREEALNQALKTARRERRQDLAKEVLEREEALEKEVEEAKQEVHDTRLRCGKLLAALRHQLRCVVEGSRNAGIVAETLAGTEMEIGELHQRLSALQHLQVGRSFSSPVRAGGVPGGMPHGHGRGGASGVQHAPGHSMPEHGGGPGGATTHAVAGGDSGSGTATHVQHSASHERPGVQHAHAVAGGDSGSGAAPHDRTGVQHTTSHGGMHAVAGGDSGSGHALTHATPHDRGVQHAPSHVATHAVAGGDSGSGIGPPPGGDSGSGTGVYAAGGDSGSGLGRPHPFPPPSPSERPQADAGAGGAPAHVTEASSSLLADDLAAAGGAE